MKNIVLVTSIAPKELENQKLALDSWINAGFRIVSCNVRDEIELVEKEFPQVEFVEVQRDGRKNMGKPCPYIYDMLQVAKENAVDICGIVNSDIHLHKFSEEIYEYIKKEACDKILFMRRNDVDTLADVDNFNFELFFGGIDVFFFHKTAVDLLEDDGLLLGQAMWDYWLPIMFVERGMQIKEILNPVTFHIKHAMRWSDDLTAEISWEICRKHFQSIIKESAVQFLKDKFFQIMSKPDLGVCVIKEEFENKKVCVVCNHDNRQMVEKQLLLQTHKNLVIEETMSSNGNFDYSIKLSYETMLSHSFISSVIWIMEVYNISFMSVMAYVRGNITRTLNIGNCCNAVLKRLKNEMDNIYVWKKNTKIEVCSEQNVCTACICSVFMEENEKVIWECDKFSGRTLVYPAGYMARLWVRKYRDIATQIEIKGFVDSSVSLHNTMVENIPVFSPDIVYQHDQYDKIVIVSNLYQEEIYDMLKQNVPEEKLVVWNELSIDKMRRMSDL